MTTMEDIRAKSADELKEHVGQLRKDLFNLRFQMATGEQQNTSRFSQVKKEIARAMTVRNETKTVQPKTKAAKKRAGSK